MLHKTAHWIFLFTICALLAGAFTYSNVPEQIPIHWTMNQEIDSYGPKVLLLLLPFLITAVDACFVFARRIDPKKANYRKFSSSYHILRLSTAFLFLAMQLIYCILLLDPERINIQQAITILIGSFLCVSGNIMPRFRRNYFTGIKTPWTLRDDRIWYKTHRFAGRLWFTGGLLICISTCFRSISFIIMMIIISALLILPVGYSFWLYQTLRKGEII